MIRVHMGHGDVSHVLGRDSQLRQLAAEGPLDAEMEVAVGHRDPFRLVDQPVVEPRAPEQDALLVLDQVAGDDKVLAA